MVEDIPLSGWSEHIQDVSAITTLDKPSVIEKNSTGSGLADKPSVIEKNLPGSGLADIGIRRDNNGRAESLPQSYASVVSDSKRDGSSFTSLDRAMSIRGGNRNLSSVSGTSVSTMGDIPDRHPGWDETKDEGTNIRIQDLENLAGAMVQELLGIPNVGGGREYFNAGQNHYFPNLTIKALATIPRDDLLLLSGRLDSVLTSLQTELKAAPSACLLADEGVEDKWKVVRAQDSALRFGHSQITAAIGSRMQSPHDYRPLEELVKEQDRRNGDLPLSSDESSAQWGHIHNTVLHRDAEYNSRARQ